MGFTKLERSPESEMVTPAHSELAISSSHKLTNFFVEAGSLLCKYANPCRYMLSRSPMLCKFEYWFVKVICSVMGEKAANSNTLGPFL